MIFIPQTGLPSTRGFITDDSGVSASKSLVHVTPILPTTSLPPPGPSRGNPTDLPRPTLPHNSHHLFDVAVLEGLPLKSHVPYPSNTYISTRTSTEGWPLPQGHRLKAGHSHKDTR